MFSVHPPKYICKLAAPGLQHFQVLGWFFPSWYQETKNSLQSVPLKS